MTDNVNVPPNCRQRLAAEGKKYLRSSCAVCGRFAPRWQSCDAALAAAPKAEQEPVAWLLINAGGSEVITRDHPGEWPNATVQPLYTHPAPFSDELLEAVAKDAAERVHKNGGCVPQLAYAPILFALQDGLAKHKEPQS